MIGREGRVQMKKKKGVPKKSTPYSCRDWSCIFTLSESVICRI